MAEVKSVITEFQYREMLDRTRGRTKDPSAAPDAVEREVEDLHKPIIQWCHSFVPIIPYIYHRSDKRSGITEGAQDFTIFYKNRVLCIEAKSKTGKRTTKQLAWALMMESQGFSVHVIRSMAEFEALLKSL